MFEWKKCFDAMSRQIGAHQYSGAKSIAEWCRAIWPEKFDAGQTENGYNLWALADAAMNLGDYQYADQIAEKLADGQREYYPEIIRKIRDICAEKMGEREFELECPDERLKPMMERMMYVFSEIRKPVRVFVSESREAYEEFFKEAFPGVEIAPYEKFVACCFYYDESCYRLVFKKAEIDKLDDGELLGMCAHECAHLDLSAKEISTKFSYSAVYRHVDMHINERLADLYAISKGFAFELYRNRAKMGTASCAFSADEIESFVRKMIM